MRSIRDPLPHGLKEPPRRLGKDLIFFPDDIARRLQSRRERAEAQAGSLCVDQLIIGHVSSATTLNTYTHITDEMRQKAAINIDQGIAKMEVQLEQKQETEKPHAQEPFTPVLPVRRRPGTGYLKQIRENLWEGRYSPIWPDGKKHSRNVYGHTEAESE